MRRRDFFAVAAGAASYATATPAQQRLPVIAVLNAGSAASTQPYAKALIEGMSALGYVDGRDVRIEYRFADGDLARLPNLAAELVALNPAVIISAPVAANLAVARLTTTIPIVMASGTDPVGFGLVTSLSHPGGNVTGMSIFADELPGKQLELAREFLPGLRKAGLLLNVTNRLHAPQLRGVSATATRLGTELVNAEVKSESELEGTFAALRRDRRRARSGPS